MSKIRIIEPNKVKKRELLSYVESLGGTSSPGGSALKNGVLVTSFDISTKDTFSKYNIISEIGRKLDTMNIAYEVID
tara:strand:+ start:5508 stop:5738 length:231 start_codon:yes stop_codon:yes gene_type:complete